MEAYKQSSPDGPDHWPVFFEKVKRMILEEPKIPLDALGKIHAPTMVMAADDDIVTLDCTLEMYRAILAPSSASFPGRATCSSSRGSR